MQNFKPKLDTVAELVALHEARDIYTTRRIFLLVSVDQETENHLIFQPKPNIYQESFAERSWTRDQKYLWLAVSSRYAQQHVFIINLTDWSWGGLTWTWNNHAIILCKSVTTPVAFVIFYTFLPSFGNILVMLMYSLKYNTTVKSAVGAMMYSTHVNL